MREPRSREVVGDRPVTVLDERSMEYVTIGDDWKIYNAPRPLYGTVTWVDPKHGIEGWFFAAINPFDEDAARWTKHTLEWDGCLLIYVSQEDWHKRVMEYGKQLAEEYHVDLSDFDFKEIEATYRNSLKRSGGVT